MIEIDLAMVATILATGLFGMPVASLIQLIKGWLKWIPDETGHNPHKVKVRYILAPIVSAVATAAFLVPLGTFTIPVFAGLSIIVWAEATGLFKLKKA